VSELPKGWANASLQELCKRLVDGSHNPPPAVEVGRPMLSARNITEHGISFDEIRQISQRDFEAEDVRTAVSTGDVLLTIVGSIGRTAVVSEGVQPFALQRSVAVLKPVGIASRYLSYALSTPSIQQWFTTHAKGTAQKGIYLKTLGTLQIPIAPRREQSRIVAKLEELLSDLDAGVAELKAAQKKLAQYRQSLLKAAVEGRLTEAWRAQHRPTETGAQLLDRILTERRARWEAKQLAKFQAQGKTPPKDWQKKYPEPVRPDTAGLPELPKGWVWASIGECFHVVVGATPSRKEPSYWNGGISWVSSGEVRFNRISTTKETITEAGLRNSSTQINPVGTVLLGMIGEGKTRGQVAILDIEAANNQNCAAIWVAEAPVPPEFVYYWLWSRYNQTRRGSSGNNQPALNKSIVERILMPLPPLAEAQELVRLVGATLEEIGQQELAISLALQQSTAQRQNILRAAFSGQLVPQDPNDEPASVLLERIRAERAAQQAGKKSRGRKAREMV
jgi:type I restriction enzyme, S subunit